MGSLRVSSISVVSACKNKQILHLPARVAMSYRKFHRKGSEGQRAVDLQQWELC